MAGWGVLEMRFNIYGHYDLDVIRDGTQWKVFELGEGKRALLHDVVIPSEVGEHEVATYLDDLFHELAKPGQSIRRVG
jgi:hypothetical protein